MKQYLIDFFKYNDWANRKLLESIRQLPKPGESAKLFGHLVNSLDKWLNRICRERDDSTLAWYDKEIPVDQLESNWHTSLNKWLAFLEKTSESDLEGEISFKRPSDGKSMRVKLRDIILQINYHSIHHRAQISRIIREQGLTPPATDYIFTVLREA